MKEKQWYEWFLKRPIASLCIFFFGLLFFLMFLNIIFNPEYPYVTDNTEEEKEKDIVYEIGESFMIDEISYTINSINTTKVLGGLIFKKEAGGTFYIISITAKNEGKKPREYFTPSFEINDDQEREFSDDRSASSYADKYGEKLSFEQLQPGLSKTGIIVFDLPDDATGLKLRVKNGAWGWFDAYVNLQR